MRYYILIGLFFIAGRMGAQTVCFSDEDVARFNDYVEVIQQKGTLSFPDLIIETGLFFRDVPYVGGSLEYEPEVLQVNLGAMDCTTFVETVLALSRAAGLNDLTFERFTKELQRLRYRGGVIDGYPSRLHYMSEWIYDNGQKGIVKDVTKEIGGEPYPLNLSFMSTHTDNNKIVKRHPEYVDDLSETERVMNERPFYYIPKEQLAHYEFNEGDIVCFTTKIEGLDISHVGIIYKREGRLTFLHASTSAKSVIVQPGTLAEYTQRIKNNSGVMIVRPIRP